MSANAGKTKRVLGVSGSPIRDSYTDRAVKLALAAAEAAGCESDFVKLSEHDVAPCKACLGCVETNVCVIEDDGITGETPVLH